jgi:SAM-dependent methyltransferase
VPSPGTGGEDLYVLDLGCGDNPLQHRPFAPAATYLGVDVTFRATSAARPPSTRIRADGRSLPLPASSMDYVVASNVFGDVGLGFSFESVTGSKDPEAYRLQLARLHLDKDYARIALLRSRIREMTDEARKSKMAMIAEVGRVLIPGGSLIIIETMTPQFGAEFIKSLSGGRRAAKRDPIVEIADVRFALRELRARSRRLRYCISSELAAPGLQLWTMQAVETLHRPGQPGPHARRPIDR